jgi:hypothetical protein
MATTRVLVFNHVHVILQPRLELPKIISWIKLQARETGIGCRDAPATVFGARDYFDRWI